MNKETKMQNLSRTYSDKINKNAGLTEKTKGSWNLKNIFNNFKEIETRTNTIYIKYVAYFKYVS